VNEDPFAAVVLAVGLPAPCREYRFAPPLAAALTWHGLSFGSPWKSRAASGLAAGTFAARVPRGTRKRTTRRRGPAGECCA
jgi:hypothetical protein